MEQLKQKLVDKLIKQFLEDANNGDTTVLDEVLMKCDNQALVHALPEEEWGEYSDLLVKATKAQKKWIKKVEEVIYFENAVTQQDILNLISLVKNHPDQSAMIDHILGDDVCPVEVFEYTFTCADFLEYIGYN